MNYTYTNVIDVSAYLRRIILSKRYSSFLSELRDSILVVVW